MKVAFNGDIECSRAKKARRWPTTKEAAIVGICIAMPTIALSWRLWEKSLETAATPQSVVVPPSHQAGGAVQDGPLLAIHPDLGEIAVPSFVSTNVRLKNQSAAAISIDHLRGGCPCIAVDPDTLHLLPGETATVRIDADLTDRSVIHPSAYLMELRYTTLEQPLRTRRLRLSARLSTPFHAAPPILESPCLGAGAVEIIG